jgi:hypothetical protein
MNLQHTNCWDILDMSPLYIIFIFPYENNKQLECTINTSIEHGQLLIVTEIK